MTTETTAFALLREAFPDMTLIEVIKEQLMTDVIDATAANADTDWSDVETSAYPEHPANPHNHRFTISFDPTKPPFVVVRANTAAELKEAFDELVGSGAYAVMTAAQAALRSGGAAPAPAQQAPNQFQAQAQQTFNQQPAQQYPGQPGTAPMPWQNVGAPAPQQQQWGGSGGQPQAAAKTGPKPRPDWPQVYKINVPFNAKDAFKAYREQFKDAFKGKVAWAGGGEYWVHGDVVQAFVNDPHNYTPMAA